MSTAAGTVGGLWRYPVKSMLGEELETATVGPLGLLGDRAYAVVDARDGTVASAKSPRRWAGLLGFRAEYTAEPEPGLPLPPAEIRFPDGSLLRSDDERVHTALSELLGADVRLSADPVRGAPFEEVWPDIEGLAPQGLIDGTRVGHEETGESRSAIPLGTLVDAATFFDLATLHLLTTATLERLGDLAPDADFHVARYRPNVLVDTGDDGDPSRQGFVEDAWCGRTVHLGAGEGAAAGVSVAVSIPTMRCVMTTLAQDGRPADTGTLRAIAKHHRVAIPDMGTFACAGVYGDVATPGTVAVGDPVAVR